MPDNAVESRNISRCVLQLRGYDRIDIGITCVNSQLSRYHNCFIVNIPLDSYHAGNIFYFDLNTLFIGTPVAVVVSTMVMVVTAVVVTGMIMNVASVVVVMFAVIMAVLCMVVFSMIMTMTGVVVIVAMLSVAVSVPGVVVIAVIMAVLCMIVFSMIMTAVVVAMLMVILRHILLLIGR